MTSSENAANVWHVCVDSIDSTDTTRVGYSNIYRTQLNNATLIDGCLTLKPAVSVERGREVYSEGGRSVVRGREVCSEGEGGL